MITRVLRILAAFLSAGILLAAWHDVSRAWDVWFYHLPFAARAAGVLGPDTYVFHPANEARYAGFPLLAERLQGLFWRVTGRPEAANLVAAGALAMFVVWLRRAHRVPLHLGALGLLAIPFVQIHASSCYVDLPANLAASALVIEVIGLWVFAGDRDTGGSATATATPTGRKLAGILALAAVVVNMRVPLHGLVALCLVAAAPKLLPPLVRAPSRRPLWLGALALPLVFATPLWNLAVHHNPYYPIRLSILGLRFPGLEDVYGWAPPALQGYPKPVRWLCSVLEIGIRPFSSTRRWTIDQWMEGPIGGRMGGFFNAYVVLQVALLVWLALRDPGKQARRAAAAFAGLTVVTTLWPQSHELRYYMYWMIVLVALNLILIARSPSAPRLEPRVGLALAAAAGAVLWVTNAGYAYPSGSTFAELVREKVDRRIVERAREGDRICVAKEPWSFLYAAPFHAWKHYVVQEASLREDCGQARWEE